MISQTDQSQEAEYQGVVDKEFTRIGWGLRPEEIILSIPKSPNAEASLARAREVIGDMLKKGRDSSPFNTFTPRSRNVRTGLLESMPSSRHDPLTVEEIESELEHKLGEGARDIIVEVRLLLA